MYMISWTVEINMCMTELSKEFRRELTHFEIHLYVIPCIPLFKYTWYMIVCVNAGKIFYVVCACRG